MAKKKYLAGLLGFLLLLLLSYSGSIQAQISINQLIATGNTINTAVPFLTIPPDARANALGGCGVASSPDINSQHWNVAKYAFMDEGAGISLNYTPWLRTLLPDMNLAYMAGYFKPSQNQAISASIRYFSLSEIFFNTSPPTSFNPNEMSVDIGYSRLITESLFAGIALRYVHSDLVGTSNTGLAETSIGRSVALDMGIYYNKELTFIPLPAYYAFGIHISNLGKPISYTADDNKIPIPANLRIGNSFEISPVQDHAFILNLDLNKLLVATRPIIRNDTIIRGMAAADNYFVGLIQSFYDAPGIQFDDGSYSSVFREELAEIIVNTGMEYTYAGKFFLRGGYFYETQIKGNRQYFSLGGGIKYRFLSFDIAAYIIGKGSNSPLRNTLTFSLAITV